MKKFFTILSISASLILSSLSALNGQMIWPGDINNNGIVNGVDWLYWGVGFQNSGPARPDASIDWAAQPMGAPWAQQLPGDQNYAYADVNGDGVVNMEDATAINTNFKLNHGTLTEDAYQVISDESAPPFLFETSLAVAVPTERDGVDMVIGTEALPFSSIYGFTFVMEYPPNAIEDEGFLFELQSDFLQDEDNLGSARVFIENDSQNGKVEFTVVRTSQTNVSGFGAIGKIKLLFSDLQDPDLPEELLFEITKAMVVDVDMNSYPVNFGSFSYGNPENGGGTNGGTCPNVIAPVCGSNGVTYINSCFAEAAGIFDYTLGTCFTDGCIDYEQINPSANCATVYEPVCGCNGVTYPNECTAEAAGVVSTTVGPCSTSSCYDPIYTVVSSATTLNPITGAITLNCTTGYDPVCGCNGVTYPNACTAEASGITVYTSGTCGSTCIDYEQMNPDAVCTANYDPVCGCNGVTYPNPCEATAAGVVAYTYGACGGVSSWCSSALPVQCGDFLPYESTAGGVNNISQYPGCSNSNFQAPEKVYMINKTSAGDLQIGIEILTPGLDLDLFLLADNCNQVICLESSTTSNSSTNNEGIIYEDAPIGTYYIVVDGQYSSSVGTYRLEVSCGYLYCGDAVPLSCGVPYTGTNAYGHDDVSLYSCGNVLNVENNGPEIVHSFTVTDAGPVDINLTGLSANLELFLLESCDRGACVEYSQNPGYNNEHITAFLQAGTYYIVVDGYNGAVGDYTLEVDCDNSCDLTLVNLTSSPSSCGQSSGSITIGTTGGTANYLIHYSGPISGSFTTSANSCTIYNLPPGSYVITKTDYFGCSVHGYITILGGSNLSATLTPEDAVCMDAGSIWVSINNGSGPYTVYVNGPTNGVVNVNSNSFNIGNLAAGDYTIHITDNTGCSISQQVTVEHSAGNFTWNYTVSSAGCGSYGAIHINTYNGDAPYNVWVSGPVTGGATVYASSFNIIDLPGGTYQVTVEDNNWCATTQTIIVPDQNISIDLIESEGICGEDGSIQVFISNGSPQYQISWIGPENGSVNVFSNSYVIPNLTSGTYTINVTDASGCTDYQTVTVNNSEDDGLTVNIIPLDGGCNQNGALWIDIYNGSPIYTITWTGPVSGTTTTYEDGFDIPNLPGGTYTVIITDINGCSSTHVVTININGDLDVDLTPQPGICGQNGAVFVSISGGTPSYTVSWTGPSSGSIMTIVNAVNIPNLLAGTYTIAVTDSEGCTDYAITQVISTEGNINVWTTVSEANCSTGGTIGLNITGGSTPYQISWTGPESGSMTAMSGVANITDLTSGTYNIYVSDNNGCSESTTATINNNGDLDVSLVGNNAICNQYGNIGVYISNGTGPFQISWFGPVNGNTTSFSNVFQIDNTPPGTYTVVITDANGCSTSGPVTVNNTNQLQAATYPLNGACGSTGAIQVNILQGAPQFNITWNGPISGSTDIFGNNYTIENLPSGQYTVVVTDANGCTQTYTETIDNSNGGITITAALIYNDCGQYNTIWVDIVGGTPPYTIIWTSTNGGENGTATTNEDGYEITDLPPGTYKITVIDANGCMIMQQGIIIYPAPIDLFSVTPNDGVCGEPGSLTINITGGTPTYIVSWNGPVSGTQSYFAQGAYTLPNLPGGTYTFTLTDQNGCTETETVVLNIGQSQVEITTALIYNECGQYNTIWVDIIGGTPPYTITWIGNNTGTGTGTTIGNGFEIMDLPPDTFKVVVVDVEGCTDLECDIIVYPAPINIFTAIPINGECGETGDVVITVLDGTPAFNLSWIGPISGSTMVNMGSQTLSGFPSGTYTFTLIDANGCTETEIITVTNNVGDVEITTAIVYNECGQYNTIWVDITGGVPTYIISWTGTVNGTGTTTDNGFEITDLPPGTYKVTVIDANGCMHMVQGIIIYPAPIDLFSAWAIDGVCGSLGQIQVQITAGTAPYTLDWSGPSSGTQITGGGLQTINNLPAGTYTLTLTDANGCTEIEVVSVSSSEGDLQLSAYGNNGNCQQTPSITAQVLGGSQGTYTLTWTGPENGTATIGNAPYTIPNLTPGIYTLQVADANGCDDQAVVQVTMTEDDLNVYTTANAGVCGGNGSINVTISGGAAPYTVSWTGLSSGSSTIGGNFIIIPNLPSGGYGITVSDANGCVYQTSNAVQNTPGDLDIYLVPVPGNCGSLGEIHVTVNGSSAPYNISWTGPSSGSTSINGNFTVIPNLTSGFYTITASTNDGCTDSAGTNLYNSEDDLSIFTNPNNGDCGENGSIDVNVVGAESDVLVSWSGPVNGSMTISGTSTTIGNLPTGFYTITASSGGCSDASNTTVYNAEDDLNIYATFQAGPCGGNGNIVATFSGASAPYLISWNGPVSGSATTVSNTMTIYDLPDGFYTVSVTSGTCFDQTSVTVNNGDSGLDFAVDPIHASCGEFGAMHVYIAEGTAPFNVSWSGPSSGSMTTSDTDFYIPDLPSGTYYLTIIDNNNCSMQLAVIINGGFEITLVGEDGICGDDTAIHVSMFDGNAPYTITWTGYISGSAVTYNDTYDIPYLPGGTYHVEVEDANGCVDSGTVTVTSGPTDLEVVHTVSNNGCGSFNNIWMDFFNGTGPYTIIWSGPASGSITVPTPFYDITEVPSGTYVIVVIDGQGCVDVQIVVVSNIIDNLDVSFNSINGSCGGTGAVAIHINGGTPQYEIDWYLEGTPIGTGQTIQSNFTITNLASGNYWIRVEDANGCEQTADVVINNGVTSMELDVITSAPGCTNTGTIGVLMGGGVAPYSISWTGAQTGNGGTNNLSYMITGLTGGIYNVQVVDANGCTGYVIVDLPGGPTGTISADFDVEVDGLEVAFTNMSNSGTYSWNFGDGNTSYSLHPTHTYNNPGSYNVCLTVVASCGTDTHCETVNVTTGGNLALLDVGDNAGGSGSTIYVPVYAYNLSNLISLAGSFAVVDETIATIMGVSPGDISPYYNAANQTFSYYNNSGETNDLNNANPLFYLEVLLTGSIGESTIIEFSNSPLPIEVGTMIDFLPTVVPYTLSSGTVTIENTGAVAGLVSAFWGEGIMNAEVEVSSIGFENSMMTTESGNYSLPQLPLGQEYTVSVEKDNLPENGLSTYGLFIGQRFLLGMDPVQITSPYQVVAGDANCNDAFTTLDLYLIQRMIIGVDDDFANCPSWVFVAQDATNVMPEEFDAYNVFPYNSQSSMTVMQNEEVDFIGVKVGDILGQASPNMFTGDEEGDDRNAEDLFFEAPNTQVSAGEEVTLYFTSNDFADIVSYQFGLAFDTDKVMYEEFIPSEVIGYDAVVAGATNADEGKLRVSWYSADGFGYSADSSMPLFGIRFTALQNIEDWATVLRVDPEEMLPEAYTESGIEFNPELSFSGVTDIDDTPLASQFELFQNSPNPFKDKTIIGFNLPEAGQATFVIHNLLGEQIYTLTREYGSGYQQISVEESLAAGVYQYTLSVGGKTATKSMIVVD